MSRKTSQYIIPLPRARRKEGVSSKLHEIQLSSLLKVRIRSSSFLRIISTTQYSSYPFTYAGIRPAVFSIACACAGNAQLHVPPVLYVHSTLLALQ